VAGDGAAADQYGRSVAIQAGTIVVGAWGDADAGLQTGSAYVHGLVGETWVEQTRLTASDESAGSLFGMSTAIDGETLLVGAARAAPAGAVYVFVRNAGVWTEQAKLVPADAFWLTDFGGEVDLDGDLAVVSAVMEREAGSDAGAAYVFRRVGVTWTFEAKLLASDAADRGFFGLSVAVEGDNILVGALNADSDGSRGAVYVFAWDGVAWAETDRLLASDAGGGDRFGGSLALGGDTFVAGAIRDDDLGLNAGAAYVFDRSAGVFTETAKLLSSDGSADENFGQDVGLSGDLVVVSSHADSPSGLKSGSVSVFTRAGGAWPELDRYFASDGAMLDFLGISAAIDADFVVGGAYGDDDPVRGDSSGSVHVFCTVAPAGEDCSNGVDDDGDSLVDCADPDCTADPLGDCDGDGELNETDCDPADPDVRTVPLEVPRLDVARDAFTGALLTWSDTAAAAGDGTRYESASDSLAALQGAGRAEGPCIATALASAMAADTRPVIGSGWYYLVRAVNACGPVGQMGWGFDSLGDERPACP